MPRNASHDTTRHQRRRTEDQHEGNCVP